MNPHEDQARELLAAARRDAVTLRILLRDDESPLETTLFHAQQTVEKSLKAALSAKGILFRRTHDLLALFDLAREHGMRIPVEKDIMARLAPYAVEFRYLGIRAPEVKRDEANRAANEMLAWAETMIGVDK